MHLAVDTKSELPMAIEVTPAHINDGDVAPQLIEQVKSCTNSKIDFLIMDGVYDQLKNYESAKNIGAQAIIPLNLRNENDSRRNCLQWNPTLFYGVRNDLLGSQ